MNFRKKSGRAAMYNDSPTDYTFEGTLFGKAREVGSLARALPGLSLTSLALPHWQASTEKSSGAARAPPSCYRYRAHDAHRAPEQSSVGDLPHPTRSTLHSNGENFSVDRFNADRFKADRLSVEQYNSGLSSLGNSGSGPHALSQFADPSASWAAAPSSVLSATMAPAPRAPAPSASVSYAPSSVGNPVSSSSRVSDTRVPHGHVEHYYGAGSRQEHMYSPSSRLGSGADDYRSNGPSPPREGYRAPGSGIPAPARRGWNDLGTTSQAPLGFTPQMDIGQRAWSDVKMVPPPVQQRQPETDWHDWSRWSRRSVDSAASVALTSASTLSDYPLESEGAQIGGLCDSPPSKISKSTHNPLLPKFEPTPRTPRPCLQPAKTGFALWVGNLSTNTTLMDLRELFGTPEIQSIYLIQRTGCAFVNYSSGPALDGAIALFNSRNSKLHDHELVIKAQRSDEDQQQEQAVAPPVYSPDRFFICKSLTLEDLESAKQKGLWSTQLRNREKFNRAFYEAENVYLVFSANRTSSFYGFARLETPFGEEMTESGAEDAVCEHAYDPNGDFEFVHTPLLRDPERNVYAPAGEIVIDPLRGSQFWKVEGCPYAESNGEKWAAPAKITWLSPPHNVVSFVRTRQLKNSLNLNKPVKVARDGTEIDPSVGRDLCEMFHTPQ